MSVEDIAKGFIEALKSNDYQQAESYWSDDVVSIEKFDGPMKELKGREAVHGKGEWWANAHEVHSMEIGSPLINGDQFAFTMKADITNKESNNRETLNEVCLYTVKDGKIVEERFFY